MGRVMRLFSVFMYSVLGYSSETSIFLPVISPYLVAEATGPIGHISYFHRQGEDAGEIIFQTRTTPGMYRLRLDHKQACTPQVVQKMDVDSLLPEALAAEDGSLWFIEDFSVYQVRHADGGCWCKDWEISSPTALALSFDGSTLYVLGKGATGRALYAVDLQKQEQISLLTTEIEEEGGESLVIDMQGNLYVTQKKSIVIFSSSGMRIGEIFLESTPLHMTFGGRHGKSLFIGCMDSVWALELGVQGAQASPMLSQD